MGLHGVLGDEQLPAYLYIGQTVGEHAQHVEFATGESELRMPGTRNRVSVRGQEYRRVMSASVSMPTLAVVTDANGPHVIPEDYVRRSPSNPWCR